MAPKKPSQHTPPAVWPPTTVLEQDGTAIMQDVVMESTPTFAAASLMIGAAQSQSRAMAAEVAALQNFFTVGLTNAAISAVRILDEPSLQQRQLDAFLAANQR